MPKAGEYFNSLFYVSKFYGLLSVMNGGMEIDVVKVNLKEKAMENTQ